MLGSQLSAISARGFIGRDIKIQKVREPGTVAIRVQGVFVPPKEDPNTFTPTDRQPLLVKGLPSGDRESAFVAIWPGSIIDVRA